MKLLFHNVLFRTYRSRVAAIDDWYARHHQQISETVGAQCNLRLFVLET